MANLDEALAEARKRIEESPTANVIFDTGGGYTRDELVTLAEMARGAGFVAKPNATADTVIISSGRLSGRLRNTAPPRDAPPERPAGFRIDWSARPMAADESSPSKTTSSRVQADKKKVFIIHGRNRAALHSVEHFLRALALEPLDFNELAADMPSEFVGNIVLEGLKRAHGIVVLFTPDEYATLAPALREDNERDERRWQSRPNVLFEAGIAFGSARERSVLATMGASVSLFSDVSGVHLAHLDNRRESRNNFRQKLIGAGCAVDLRADSYTDPARSGDFETPVASLCDMTPNDPFAGGAPQVSVALSPPLLPEIDEAEAVAVLKTWVRSISAASQSLTYDALRAAALPPGITATTATLRLALPKAVEGTNFTVEIHANTASLTYHLPMPTTVKREWRGGF